MAIYPNKPALTLAALAALMTVPDYIPQYKDFRVIDWHNVEHIFDFKPKLISVTPVEDEQQRLRPNTDITKTDLHKLSDPANTLRPFYEALMATEQKRPGAVTNILHYGDSPTAADLITADARALFQKQFGDAGHGFTLIAKPWAWYEHRGVTLSSFGWKIDPATQSTFKDGLFGLGGVAFHGHNGDTAMVRSKDATHTVIEVSFLEQIDGGTFVLLGDGSPIGTIDTAGVETKPGFEAFQVPPGITEFSIGQIQGKVRLFGMRLGKQQPGVVYNSLGLNGAYISVLARMFNETHWAAQLRHAKPQLVVINYGTNESVYQSFVDQSFENELVRTVDLIRRAVPQSAILIMSPMDRGQKMANGEISSVPALTKLVTMEQRVAAQTGCAFFNTFEAMGGPGTMGRWYQSEPRMVGADLIHPMPAGAKIVGNLLYAALLDGYYKFKAEHVKAKFAEPKAADNAKK